MTKRVLYVSVCFLVAACVGETSNTGEPIANNSANNVVANNGANNVVANNGNNGFVQNNGDVPGECTATEAADVYGRYIEPLVTGGQPSSCNQCHLKGVDLSMFVQDTPCQSMACLLQLDLVDLDAPEASPILQQIQLAQPTELITDAVIQREYDGFKAWIEFNATRAGDLTCHEAVCGDVEDPCNSGGTFTMPPEGVLNPLGQCTEDDVAAKFATLVYSSRDRCAGCHDPRGPRFEDEQNPIYWLDMNYDDGGEAGANLRTMYNVIGRGYITESDPELSLLLLKPLPEDAGGVFHKGGDKLSGTGDATYRIWLDWIEYYLECRSTGNLMPLKQEPYVSIFNQERLDLASGERINFNGRAIDPQDGELPLRWESSLDGMLGRENNLADVQLSPGEHTITLSAQDSDGNLVTDTVMRMVR